MTPPPFTPSQRPFRYDATRYQIPIAYCNDSRTLLSHLPDTAFVQYAAFDIPFMLAQGGTGLSFTEPGPQLEAMYRDPQSDAQRKRNYRLISGIRTPWSPQRPR